MGNEPPTTIFRLVRDSEPLSALYLHGMEIIHWMDNIHNRRDHTVTFSIILQNGTEEIIYVSDHMNDVRTKLYSCMLPCEITFQPRPEPHHRNDSDIWRRKSHVETIVSETTIHDRREIFRLSSAAYHNTIRIQNKSSCHLDPAMLRRRRDSCPIIESKLEFDDDYDCDEHFGCLAGDKDVDNGYDADCDEWENSMIRDVVSSLITVGIHDTSLSTSRWTTLSSSSSSLSSDDESTTDKDNENGSEMEMAEIYNYGNNEKNITTVV